MEPVDLKAVADWMSEQGLGEGPLEDVSAVTGGTQNVMLRFTRSGRDYVLRRGPRHLRTRSNTVILRETKVLAALADSDVPHPHLIATCEDTSVLGDAVFYLMDPIDGFNAGEALPALHAGDAGVRHGMGLSMADALAKLGAVDHVAVGLADFGKPDGFLERQVPRWLSELESYQQYEGYPGPQIPGIEQVAGWLEEHRPSNWMPGIMHGDYHAANVMFSRTGPEVVAIVDWEMCTIGDPLLDLGWLLATWRQSDGSAVFSHALGGQEDWPAPTSCWSGTPPTRFAICRTSPGTRCWPASSSASSSRARWPERARARPRRKSATSCTRPRCTCSSGRWGSSKRGANRSGFGRSAARAGMTPLASLV